MEFRYDRVVVQGRRKILDDPLGNFSLPVIDVKDGAAVLGTDVVPLAVWGSWIVNREENLQNLLVGDHGRIELHHDDLNVLRCFGANRFVVGRFGFPARVATYGSFNALNISKNGFHAPKTPSTENGNFVAVRIPVGGDCVDNIWIGRHNF